VETGGWTPEKNLVERVLLKPLVAVVGAVDAVIGLEVLMDREKQRNQSVVASRERFAAGTISHEPCSRANDLCYGGGEVMPPSRPRASGATLPPTLPFTHSVHADKSNVGGVLCFSQLDFSLRERSVVKSTASSTSHPASIEKMRPSPDG